MKKTILPLILLIAGLALGYLIGKNKSQDFIAQKEAFRKEIIKKLNDSLPKLQGSKKAQEISEVLAKFMMRDFRTRNQSSATPLQTINKIPLEGFFIDIDPIKKIVDDTRGFDGVSFYLGTNPNAVNETENYYTLLFTGAKWKTVKRPNLSDTTILVNEGPIYDYIDPCPTVCGDLRPPKP
jgi:hypothetical protein